MARRILVVDDDHVMRNLLEEFLSDEGFNVTTVPDGIRGLELLRSDHFDLVFLDVDMPNLSGLQVCRLIRNDPTRANLPVIMLTARDQKKDEFRGLESGATAYLTKPFDPPALLKTLSEIFDHKQSAAVQSLLDPKKIVDKKFLEDAEDIIFEAGELQEQQLFEITLLNKIYEIITAKESLNEAIKAISSLIFSVVNFDISSFLLVDDEDKKLFMYVWRPSTRKFLNLIKKQIIKEFCDRTNVNINTERMVVILEDWNNNLLKRVESDDMIDFYSTIMESKEEKFGVLCVSRGTAGKFSEKEIKVIDYITKHATIVIDNIRMYEKLKKYAVVDGLTGLYNHRYFQEELEREFNRSKRYNLSLSLIMLDIDHFKGVNDTYGHQQGDFILKGLAHIMRKSIRDIDTLARYGGEEFVIILPETTKQNAFFVAERLRKEVELHNFACKGGTLRLTVSIGVAGYPADDINTKFDFISKVDESLYSAKRGGRNQVCIYPCSKEIK